MNIKHDTIVAILRVVMFGGCWWWAQCDGLWGNDEFQRYVYRSDRMTMTSGDAPAVNAMAHIATPWPRGVNDRRIVTDSTHMQRALDRYHRGAEPPDPMPNVPKDYGSQFGSMVAPKQQGQSSATGVGGGAASPASAGQ